MNHKWEKLELFFIEMFRKEKEEKEKQSQEKKLKKLEKEKEKMIQVYIYIYIEINKKNQERICERCERIFTLATNTEKSCTYHPGKWKKKLTTKYYSCCKNTNPNSPGCTILGYHISK